MINTQTIMTQSLFGRNSTPVKRSSQKRESFDMLITNSKAAIKAKSSNSKPSEKYSPIRNTQKTREKVELSKDADVITEEDVFDGEIDTIIAEIMALFQQVQTVTTESLHISPEQLDAMLKEQGKTVLDLFDADTLKDVVLSSYQESDITAILTNENLANHMDELLENVQEILNNSNLPIEQLLEQLSADDTETINQLITQLINGSDTPTDTKDMVDEASKDKYVPGIETNEKEIIFVKEKPSQVYENYVDINNPGTSNLNTDSSSANSSDANLLNSNSISTNSENTDDTDIPSTHDVQVFADQLMNSVQGITTDVDGSLVQTNEIRDIANQIIETIKIVIKPDQTSMDMQLNPENLGRVQFSVQSKDGVMTAQFVVQNELTKEAIESHMSTLRESLDQQGIKIEVIEVTVSEFSFGQSNQANSDEQMRRRSNENRKNISISNKLSLEDAISMDELDELDGIDDVNQLAQIPELLGNQVDYIA